MGKNRHGCIADIVYSTVLDWSTCHLPTGAAASSDQCPPSAAHVRHASPVDSVCDLSDAISRPSPGAFCLGRGNTDLPQLGAARTALRARTLLSKVGAPYCMKSFSLFFVAQNFIIYWKNMQILC